MAITSTPTLITDVVVEMGGKANPPGFDDEIRGLEVGA